jgi:glycosyltransferase involved in cell wall biosynthesis
MTVKTDLLVLGSKEYPRGISSNYETYLGGGVETFVDSISPFLLERGYRIHLFVKHFPKQARYEVIRNDYHVYRTPYINGRFLSLTSIAFFNVLEGIRQNPRKEFDIIFSNGLWPSIAGLFLRVMLGKPLVIRTAGINFVQWGGFASKLLYFLEKRVYSAADQLIFLSEEDRANFQRLLQKQYPNSTIIQTGVFSHRRIAIKRILRRIRITFIGRLKHVKGVEYLVTALNLLPKELKGRIICSIIGEGKDKNDLLHLAKQVDVTPQVRFVGYQENVHQFLSQSDIFILPSLSEGLPVSALEAMSHGVPTIITKLKVPFPNNCVMYIEPKSPQAIADAIHTLAANYELRENLSLNCYEYVNKFHNWEEAAEKYDTVFRKVTRRLMSAEFGQF